MRPVSIAWGGVLALVLTSAAAAAPVNPQGGHALNPQPLPPGSQAQQRQTQAGFVVTVCASRPHAHKAGGDQGRAAASHGSGAGKASTACASGKH